MGNQTLSKSVSADMFHMCHIVCLTHNPQSSILQAVAQLVFQHLQPFGKLFAEAFNIKVLVHLLAATLQAPSILWARLLPALFGSALRQTVAKPGDRSLMQ